MTVVAPFGYIIPSADGTWEPADEGDGLYCCLLQVWGYDDELLDVVAWQFGSPSPWWLRWGYINFLGIREIARVKKPSLNGTITRLVATPQQWLADGGEAICILNWTAPLLPLLDEIGDVVCESPALERRLRSAIARETSRHIHIRGVA